MEGSHLYEWHRRSTRPGRDSLQGHIAHCERRRGNESSQPTLGPNALRRDLQIVDGVKSFRLTALDNCHDFGELFSLDHAEDDLHRTCRALGFQGGHPVAGLLQAID